MGQRALDTWACFGSHLHPERQPLHLTSKCARKQNANKARAPVNGFETVDCFFASIERRPLGLTNIFVSLQHFVCATMLRSGVTHHSKTPTFSTAYRQTCTCVGVSIPVVPINLLLIVEQNPYFAWPKIIPQHTVYAQRVLSNH